MAQNLNLYHPGLEPQRELFTAAQGLLAVVALTIGLTVTIVSLRALARSTEAQHLALVQAVDQQRGAVTSSASAANLAPAQMQELQRLRQRAAGERRLRSVVDSGEAGAGGGFSDELLALGRRSSATVWITGITLSRPDNAIELRGRTTDPAFLPDYLHSLQLEPTFKGRQFAQLQVSADGMDAAGAPLPYADFLLRSTVSAEAAARSSGTPR